MHKRKIGIGAPLEDFRMRLGGPLTGGKEIAPNLLSKRRTRIAVKKTVSIPLEDIRIGPEELAKLKQKKMIEPVVTEEERKRIRRLGR